MCLITNTHASEFGETTSSSSKRVREVPLAVADYNQHVHGVDTADSYLNKWLANHKNRSWKRTAFFGVLKLCISNMHLIWNSMFPQESLSQKDFIIALAEQLARKPPKQQVIGARHLLYKP